MHPEQPHPVEPQQVTPLAFHVLLALTDDPKHGYAIGKEVEARSGGRLRPGTGSLYQAIRRLHDAGLIESVHAPSDGPTHDSRRHYYRITASGKDVAAREAEHLASLVTTAASRGLISSPTERLAREQ